MILDSLANAATYYSLHPLFERALNYLAVLTPDSPIPDGRQDIMGDDLFAMHQTNALKPVNDGKLETHRRYIDIQHLVTGSEYIGYAPFANQPIAIPYSAEKDIAFHTGVYSLIPLMPGQFMILYPQDVHAPGLTLDPAMTHVRKVILKIALNPAR